MKKKKTKMVQGLPLNDYLRKNYSNVRVRKEDYKLLRKMAKDNNLSITKMMTHIINLVHETQQTDQT